MGQIKDSRLLKMAEFACLCILHLEMRVGEKLIALLLNLPNQLYAKPRAKELLDKILSFFNEILAGRYKLGLILTRNCHNLIRIFTPGTYVVALDRDGVEEEVNLLPVDSEGNAIDLKFELLTSNDDLSSVVSHNFSTKIILPVKVIPQN